MTKVVIVGGVAGGARMAARLRRDDETAEIITLERGLYISYANCNLPYYIGGMITDRDALQFQIPEHFHAHFNVGMRVGNQVVSVDTEKKYVVVRHGEETYKESYDRLVPSPGAGPAQPGILGIGENHVFTLRNIPNTYTIYDFAKEHKPVSCVVVGAGFIGLEVAENLAEQGTRVSVVEGAVHVVPPIDMDMAHAVHNYVRTQGISLYLGHACTAMDKDGIISDSGVKVLADMVIMSIGMCLGTGFSKDDIIEPGARGEILVNQYVEASTENVYTLGDTVSVKHMANRQKVLVPPAPPAGKQGRIVGDSLYGRKTAYKRSWDTSVMKFFDMTVAMAREKEESLITRGRPYRKIIITSASWADYYPGEDMITVKIIFDPVIVAVLGAQIVGGRGVDKRIDNLASAIRFKLNGYDLQEVELAYTPPFPSVKDLVNIVGHVIGNVTEGPMRSFYLEDLDGIPGDAVRLDVRTVEKYVGGTIPGFIDIPLDSLRERIDELNLARDIYIICQIGLRGYPTQRILDRTDARTWNLSGGYRFCETMTKDEQSMTAAMTMCTECGMEINTE